MKTIAYPEFTLVGTVLGMLGTAMLIIEWQSSGVDSMWILGGVTMIVAGILLFKKLVAGTVLYCALLLWNIGERVHAAALSDWTVPIIGSVLGAALAFMFAWCQIDFHRAKRRAA